MKRKLLTEEEVSRKRQYTERCLGITDIMIHSISPFLDDWDAMSMFKANKVYYTMINKYRFKSKFYSHCDIPVDRLHQCLKVGVYDNKPCNFPKNSIVRNIYLMNDFKIIGSLPNSIETIRFGLYFNRSVDKLPSTLRNLSFWGIFNQPVNHLPETLTHLTFSDEFNQNVDQLPKSLTNLSFGTNFNQPVNQLPSSITYLKFGFYFNQPVERLPSSITDITFGYYFNQPVNQLPLSVTYIKFGRTFNQPIDKLPSSVRSIEISRNYNHNYLKNLSPTITYEYPISDYD